MRTAMRCAVVGIVMGWAIAAGCVRIPAAPKAKAHKVSVEREPGADVVKVDGQVVMKSVEGGDIPDPTRLVDALTSIRVEMVMAGVSGAGAAVPVAVDDAATYETLGRVMMAATQAELMPVPAKAGGEWLELRLLSSEEKRAWTKHTPAVAMRLMISQSPGMEAAEEPPMKAIRIDLHHVEPWEANKDKAIIWLNHDEVSDAAELRERLTAATSALEQRGTGAGDVAVAISPDMVVQCRHVREATQAARAAGIEWVYFGVPQ